MEVICNLSRMNTHCLCFTLRTGTLLSCALTTALCVSHMIYCSWYLEVFFDNRNTRTRHWLEGERSAYQLAKSSFTLLIAYSIWFCSVPLVLIGICKRCRIYLLPYVFTGLLLLCFMLWAVLSSIIYSTTSYEEKYTNTAIALNLIGFIVTVYSVICVASYHKTDLGTKVVHTEKPMAAVMWRPTQVRARPGMMAESMATLKSSSTHESRLSEKQADVDMDVEYGARAYDYGPHAPPSEEAPINPASLTVEGPSYDHVIEEELGGPPLGVGPGPGGVGPHLIGTRRPVGPGSSNTDLTSSLTGGPTNWGGEDAGGGVGASDRGVGLYWGASAAGGGGEGAAVLGVVQSGGYTAGAHHQHPPTATPHSGQQGLKSAYI